MKKIKLLYFFVIAIFLFLTISITKVKADNCLFCTGNDDTDSQIYKQEKQLIEKIKIIKSNYGGGIDEITLLATILHKEGAQTALGSRYNEKFDSNSYQNKISEEKSWYDGISGKSNDDIDEYIKEQEEKLEKTNDLLDAASVIMAESSNGNFDETAYKEALTSDSSPTICGLAAASLGVSIVQLIQGKTTSIDTFSQICTKGYISANYDIDGIKGSNDKETKEKQKLRKEKIADEIIELAHYYKKILNIEENSCSVYTGGNTQAKDLVGKSREDRIKIIGPAAQSAYSATGVWASVTVAQSILESGIGEAYERSGFLNSNNVFGVKCGRPGKSCMNGYTVFSSLEESLIDRKDMFDGFSGYGDWRSATTPEAFIRQIAPSYCPVSDGCSPGYADTIISLINQYNLKKYDQKNGGSSSDGTCIGSYTYNGTVTEKMQKVVDEAKRRAGSGYDNSCEAWVEQVWSAALNISISGKQQSSAYSAWEAFKVSSDKSNIPPGAMVYAAGWPYCNGDECYQTENPYGHVGIYVGNGQVADQGGVMDLDDWINQQPAICNGKTGWFGWGWFDKNDLSK